MKKNEDELKNLWWSKKNSKEVFLIAMAGFLTELKILLRKIRKWYFLEPKDRLERFIKRLERMFLVWIPLVVISLQIKERLGI